MSTSYVAAGSNVMALIERVQKQYYPELVKRDVRVGCLIVHRETKNNDPVPALNHDGHQVLAQMKIISLRDRASGLPDARLLVDGFSWDRLSDQRKAALIDHELQHLKPLDIKATKRNGYSTGPRVDDLGRPALKIKPHDWILAGFAEVAERHGPNSIEALQFDGFRAAHAQLSLFGGEKVLEAVAHNGAPKQVDGSKKRGRPRKEKK